MEYKISIRVSWQIYDHVIYIFDELTDNVYHLDDDISKLIWMSTYNENDLKTSIMDFVEKANFSISKEQIKKDVEEFLIMMVENNLFIKNNQYNMTE